MPTYEENEINKKTQTAHKFWKFAIRGTVAVGATAAAHNACALQAAACNLTTAMKILLLPASGFVAFVHFSRELGNGRIQSVDDGTVMCFELNEA
jgi:hypothetical protein